MKIAVLGATGMLGAAVSKYMIEHYGVENVVFSARQDAPPALIGSEKWIQLSLPLENEYSLCKIPNDVDYVINCIGIIKPMVEKVGMVNTIYANAIFPHVLAEYCNRHDIRLIQITTDCVYSGKKGMYIESDPHDVSDVYGRTKSLGEPVDKSMVLRTSIIGQEITKAASLVEWVKSNRGGEVNGFTDHLWNGVTTRMFAKCCAHIMDQDLWAPELYHIFSPNIVDKCELVSMISDQLDLGIKVNPVRAPQSIDRTLDTTLNLCEALYIPDLHKQMEEL